jgi:hypothetical protein
VCGRIESWWSRSILLSLGFSGAHPSTCTWSRTTSVTRFPQRCEARSTPSSPTPPYTVEGATLFLSRAAEAVAAQSRADVFLAFGGKRPAELLGVQRAIAEMGFVVRRLVRNFNEYLGAGALGGVSHLYQLASTSEVRPLLEARYDGRLYTGDLRPPVRRYRCRGCRRAQAVGHRQPWSTIEALSRDGCPRCGSLTFLPLARSE